jgi:regulator of protease activity HflC (stomatin/prohibitin superfamily)
MWTVKYQVSDVVKYAFNVRDPEQLIRQSLGAAVVHSSEDFGVEEALWRETGSLRYEVHQRLQDRLDNADCGIEIVDLDAIALDPPKQTTEAFEKARRVKEQVGEEIEKAWRYRYALLNDAAGDAGEALAETLTALAQAEEALSAAEAEGPEHASETDLNALKDKIKQLRAQADALYAQAGGKVAGILKEGKADAERVKQAAVKQAEVFKRLNRRFEENPRILVQRLHADMVEQLLTQSGSKFFMYPRDQREIRILLEEQRKKEKPKQEESVVEITPEERQRSRGRP